MIYSKMIGLGAYLPEKIVTNKDLEKSVDTTSEWIVSRTGIHERRIAGENDTLISMAEAASKEALEKANLSSEDIDLIIVATSTPDKFFPSAACRLQCALKAKTCIAFDIQAACPGFLYAMTIADNFIRSGSVKTVLVVSTELMSKIVDWSDRSTCVLFGDGAGAAVFQASDEPGIIASEISADGTQQDIIYMNTCLFSKDYSFHMQGPELYKVAVESMVKTPIKLLERANMTVDAVDWLIPHQANLRIIDFVVKKLKFPEEKVILTVGEHANTSSASIPLALYSGIKDGRIKPGQTVLLDAFGAGLTWGAVLLRI
jgi:3-oxoacyl-[acyl-carrier-protein] synthase-3